MFLVVFRYEYDADVGMHLLMTIFLFCFRYYRKRNAKKIGGKRSRFIDGRRSTSDKMARLISIIYHMLILYLHGCWSSRPPSPTEPNKVYGVKINCTRDVFNIKIDMGKAFKGIVFAKDFLDECRVKGKCIYHKVYVKFPVDAHHGESFFDGKRKM